MILRLIIDNDTTTRYEIPLKGLGVIKCEYVGLAMMLKTGMKVAHDYSAFNY